MNDIQIHRVLYVRVDYAGCMNPPVLAFEISYTFSRSQTPAACPFLLTFLLNGSFDSPSLTPLPIISHLTSSPVLGRQFAHPGLSRIYSTTPMSSLLLSRHSPILCSHFSIKPPLSPHLTSKPILSPRPTLHIITLPFLPLLHKIRKKIPPVKRTRLFCK